MKKEIEKLEKLAGELKSLRFWSMCIRMFSAICLFIFLLYLIYLDFNEIEINNLHLISVMLFIRASSNV